MTSKEKFINLIQKEIFDHDDIYIEQYDGDWEDIKAYWSTFCSIEEKPELTENGLKVLTDMKKYVVNSNNSYTSKDIAERLGISSRSVSGSMRKLITESFVEKIGKDPVRYCLTQKGINKEF